MKTYSEKLRSPAWQKKRLEILERDGWKCVICHNGDRELQVHHVVYRKIEPQGYPNYCYQTLCVDCHQIRHELVDKIVDALRLSLKDIPTQRLQKASLKLMAEAMETMEVE